MNMPTTKGISLTHIIEALLSAAVVAGLSVYTSQKIGEERMMTTIVAVAANTAVLERLSEVTIEMRVALARLEAAGVVMDDLRSRVAKLESRNQ